MVNHPGFAFLLAMAVIFMMTYASVWFGPAEAQRGSAFPAEPLVLSSSYQQGREGALSSIIPAIIPGHRADPSSLGNLNHLQRGAFNWLRLCAHCKTASKNRISAPPTLHSQRRPHIQGKWLDTGSLCRDFLEMRPCYGLVGLVVGLLGPVSSLSHEFKKWVLRRASGEERIDKGLASDSSR